MLTGALPTPRTAGSLPRERVVVPGRGRCLTDVFVALASPLPRTRDAEQPPHATQRRNERRPLVPAHGLRITLHPPAALQPRPQPRQVGKATAALSVLSSNVSRCCPSLYPSDLSSNWSTGHWSQLRNHCSRNLISETKAQLPTLETSIALTCLYLGTPSSLN